MVNILGNIICTLRLNITTFVIALRYGVLVRYLCCTIDILLFMPSVCGYYTNDVSEEIHTTTPEDFYPVSSTALRLDRHDFQGA